RPARSSESGGRFEPPERSPLIKTGDPRRWGGVAEMRRHSSRGDPASGPLMGRLRRGAHEGEPFLVILLGGPLILTVIRVATMGLSNFPITRVDPSCLISPAPTTSGL